MQILVGYRLIQIVELAWNAKSSECLNILLTLHLFDSHRKFKSSPGHHFEKRRKTTRDHLRH